MRPTPCLLYTSGAYKGGGSAYGGKWRPNPNKPQDQRFLGKPGEIKTTSVSYTHLDVYKRQGYGNVGWGIMKKAAQLGAAVTYFAGPDGYVHDPDGVITCLLYTSSWRGLRP